MTLAYKQCLIRTNPADSRRLEFPKIITPEVEVFYNDETEKILEALEAEPINIKAMISTALYTGARRGEIVGLKWSDIDLDEGVLSIVRSRSLVFRLLFRGSSRRIVLIYAPYLRMAGRTFFTTKVQITLLPEA